MEVPNRIRGEREKAMVREIVPSLWGILNEGQEMRGLWLRLGERRPHLRLAFDTE